MPRDATRYGLRVRVAPPHAPGAQHRARDRRRDNVASSTDARREQPGKRCGREHRTQMAVPAAALADAASLA
ncbi:hypothetical protein HDG37_007456 [Paraburkholderia sp. MM5384-R2]|nr:hypothetical protein [Paraburkholderia sp. MM5384-R2]